jgi:hypothetical protein
MEYVMKAVGDRSDVTSALASWYANQSSIRRLWAVEESMALVVYVALEPSSDGDDALPVWLANQQGWTNDLKLATRRDVQLQLMASGTLDEPEGAAITQLSWRDSWE